MNFRKVGSGVLASMYITAIATSPLVYSTGSIFRAELVRPKANLSTQPSELRKLVDKKVKEVVEPTKPKPAIQDTKTLPKPIEKPSRGGEPVNNNVVRVLDGFQITYYNNEYDKTDVTASGAKTVAGHTISVDPTVIPLGTWVEIMLPDGRVLKRKAEDTGGAVHGRIIDVYADQPTEVLLGRGRIHNATVRILKGE